MFDVFQWNQSAWYILHHYLLNACTWWYHSYTSVIQVMFIHDDVVAAHKKSYQEYCFIRLKKLKSYCILLTHTAYFQAINCICNTRERFDPERSSHCLIYNTTVKVEKYIACKFCNPVLLFTHMGKISKHLILNYPNTPSSCGSCGSLLFRCY